MWSVNRSGFVIDWSRVVWSWVVWGWVGFVYWGGFVVNWGMDNRFVCRDWGGFVCWCWVGFVGRFWEGLISRSWVRLVSRSWVGFVLGVGGFSLVTNIGNITTWSSRVRDNLDTTVGKVYAVFPLDIVVVSVFVMSKDGTVMGTIIDTVVEVVHWSSNRFMIWSGVSISWSRRTSRGSNRACYQCSSSCKNLVIY